MKPAIFELPDEVLETCFRELLPRLDDERCVSVIERFNTPPDLLNSRLVCRTFYRLASPWAWRRFEFRLHEDHLDGNDELMRSLNKCAYFSAHPGFASHVRLLSLDCRADPGIIGPTLTALVPAFRVMVNLQIVTLNNFHCVEVLRDLLDKPRLHTLIITPSRQLPFPIEAPVNNIKNLKVFAVEEVRDMQRILELAPQLESFAIYEESHGFQNIDFMVLTVPWGTLREIEFFGVQDWDLLLNNFSVSSRS
jgi:hypothetical protein